jgi:hypothetical protein
MKLNRSTLALVAISLIVIVGALVLNNTGALAPAAATPTATLEGASILFPNVDQNAVVQISARNNTTGAFTTLTRDAANLWRIDATNATDRAVDQVEAVGTMGVLASLEAAQSFAADDLAPFGLDTPDTTFTLATADGAVFTLHIGALNPGGNRFYAVVESTTVTAPTPVPALTAEATPEATAESTPEATSEAVPADIALTPESTPEPVVPVTLTGPRTVFLVPEELVSGLIGLIDDPPYVPPPTALPTGTPTPNPFSEVDQTATAQALFDDLIRTATAMAPTATSAAVSTPEATPEAAATPEATAEAAATSESGG